MITLPKKLYIYTQEPLTWAEKRTIEEGLKAYVEQSAEFFGEALKDPKTKKIFAEVTADIKKLIKKVNDL